MGVHEVAANGFGSAAAAYEAARPGYPPSVVDWLISGLSLAVGSVVVDLAAGTGKLTRLLAERGANPIAVEPVAGMRAELRQAAPKIPIVAGTAEALPFRRASVDGLTVAQAFHWFDNPTSHDQIARVIRPGGRLALVWNARDRRVAWVDAVWSIMDRVEHNAPWRDHESTRSADEWTLPGFTPFHRSQFVHEHRLTRAQVVERMASVSHVAVLPDDQRAAVLQEVVAIIDAHPETKGRATLAMTYRVDCFLAERLDV
ncbi:MAG: methyltransferase domain-containing protein [Acidimicrobiia bacterium]|nr:methyltransferase domain-containing protein [Acidimicrobiia bacterium]